MWLCCENQKAPLNHHSLSIPPPEKPPNPLKQELNLKNRIVSGARTSPTSLPKKGGYTFRWSWTSIPRKWLAGRQVRGWTRNLFFRLWGIALRSGDLSPLVLTIPIRESSTSTLHTQPYSRGMVPSMSRKGNCCDNAVVEPFFKTLKTELVQRDMKGGKRQRRALCLHWGIL